jgi:type II secretion system protein I
MRPRFVCRTPVRSPRGGFTLVEVLVAIVIIEIGLLALTASSAVVIREILFVRARTTALEVARNRVESIAASPCRGSNGSASPKAGFRENWSSRLIPVATREVRDSATFTVQRLTRTVVLQTRTPCAP